MFSTFAQCRGKWSCFTLGRFNPFIMSFTHVTKIRLKFGTYVEIYFTLLMLLAQDTDVCGALCRSCSDTARPRGGWNMWNVFKEIGSWLLSASAWVPLCATLWHAVLRFLCVPLYGTQFSGSFVCHFMARRSQVIFQQGRPFSLSAKVQ
jgi:hypothetical protein